METEEAAAEPSARSRAGEIGREAGRGLRWSVLGALANRFGSFAVGLVMARLLTPADFGVFAVAMAAMYFVMHVNDMGLIAAAVQWRGRFEEVAGTAAALALVFSGLLYTGFWFLAPAFAELAGSPQATPVVRLLTAVILIDGVIAIRAAALMRRFQQDKLTYANFCGLLVQAGVSISMAAGGAGPISFAAGQVGGTLMTGLLIMWFARLPVELRIDRAVAARLLRYGVPLAAGLGVEAILTNIDYLVVGRMLGPVSLGFYLLAFNVAGWLPAVIGTAVRYVSLAGFSRLAEEDGELATGAQRTIPMLIIGVLPIAVVMGTQASALVVFLYGEPWRPAATVLQFLAVLTVVRMASGFTLDILASAGEAKLALGFMLGWIIPLVPALILGTRIGGIHGTAGAHAVVGAVVAVPLVALCLRRVGVKIAPVARALVRPLIAAGVATAVGLWAAEATGALLPLFQLSLGGLTVLVVYLAVLLPPSQLRRLPAFAVEVVAGRRRTAPDIEEEPR